MTASTSKGKLSQIESYGTNLDKIPGTREDNAYEVAEQLCWKSPDSVILPTGNGTILIGTFIWFGQLKEAGTIKKVPKIIAI